MEDVFRTIPAFLMGEDLPDEIRESIAISAWKRVAGASLCDNAEAVELKDKTLRVAVGDEIWKRHLESLAGQMIFKLNSLLRSPAITYIEFFVDDERVRKAKAGAGPLIDKEFEETAEKERSGELVEAAESISDPEMRELFLHAAAKSLARKKLRSVR